MELPLPFMVRALFTSWAMLYLSGIAVRIVDHGSPHWRDELRVRLGIGDVVHARRSCETHGTIFLLPRSLLPLGTWIGMRPYFSCTCSRWQVTNGANQTVHWFW